MMGQLCPLGTGAFDLLLDEEALEAAYEVTGDAAMDLWGESPA